MADLPPRPAVRPERPQFSSGPTVKPPGWSPEQLRGAVLGRSHRNGPGKARLAEAIRLTREVLEMPDEFLLGITPASDTGAVEMALWSMLGARPVQVMAFENFGETWAKDVRDHLALDAEILSASYGELPDLRRVRPDADLVFPWNGTTSGVRVPDADFIATDRTGLTICDATSAAFAQPLDWPKLDVVTFSWQKALGGEAAHGMIALSARAVERLTGFKPPRALPKIFRLVNAQGELDQAFFEGSTINTPSLLCVEDWLFALRWAASVGGLAETIRRSSASAAALFSWVERTPWVEPLAARPEIRSNTSVCLKIVDPRVTRLDASAQREFARGLAGLLEKEGVGFDLAAHKASPPGLRVWCGPTVDTADVEALTPWLDWAFAATVADLAEPGA